MTFLASCAVLGVGTAAAQDHTSTTLPTALPSTLPTVAGDTVPSAGAGAGAGAGADDPVGVTTTTLPEESGELGRIIPLPNTGHEPTSPGDRGGWQQVTLFFAICGVIIAIGVYVWWRSRRTRARLHAEGLDRVEWARAHGGDVRRSGGG
jgi:hypothetical protein